MKLLFLTACIYFFGLIPSVMEEKNRVIIYGETEYRTTYAVPAEFIGTYEGRKSGFLKLNADGTGEYKYDIFGYAPASCERKPINFIWGFILDKDGNLSKNERDYGFSYPILLQSTGSNSFQGCRTEVLKEFILNKGKTLHISSSDDWQKTR
jgi:hypothetical protein